jgi:hypothetical protein
MALLETRNAKCIAAVPGAALTFPLTLARRKVPVFSAAALMPEQGC